jgi:exopolysaccharide production protein ExoF
VSFGRLIVVTCALSMAPSAVRSADIVQSYVLGPQDRLMIRVQTLRRNVGEAYSWSALSGEFSVGADGAVSMPILGQVKAAGATTVALGGLISKTLQDRANLADLPSTSVEILQYRPFYVTGAVQQPGKYEFQPGLTVLQALSTAQGPLRAEDLTSVYREVVTAGGELRLLGAERVTLEARLARLKAEVSGAAKVTFPPELADRTFDPRIVEAMQDETLRFDARRGALAAELRAVDQSRALLQEELSTLGSKLTALDRQLEKTREELGTVMGLVSKGLAVTARQLAAESAQTSVENSRLDVQLAILRAQQSLANANRDLVDLPARFRQEALDEIVATRALLAQNAEKLRTAEKLLDGAELRTAGAANEDVGPSLIFTLTRITPSGAVTRTVPENEMLEPGDVLKVSLSRVGQD